MRRAVRDKFARENFKVYEAKNGEEGLHIALTEHPDIILLDVMMPIMDGLEALHELRKDVWGKTVPVILLTNISDTDQVSSASEDNATGFLVKSDWKLEDVVTKVNEVLNLKK